MESYMSLEHVVRRTFFRRVLHGLACIRAAVENGVTIGDPAPPPTKKRKDVRLSSGGDPPRKAKPRVVCRGAKGRDEIVLAGGQERPKPTKAGNATRTEIVPVWSGVQEQHHPQRGT